MLEFTGERFLPEVSGQIALEHLHRYLLAERLVAHKDVLDIASGEGYGSALLAKHAASVVGVDISRAAVEHARARYVEITNLRFLVGDCAEIPLPDGCVDFVVSFETIEHHDKHEDMLLEIKRVLRPGGVLIISSPDRYNYSIRPGYQNEFHVKELFRYQFEDLLARHFRNCAMLGQRVAYGSFVLPERRAPFISFRRSGEVIDAASGIVDPVYLIAVASEARLPSLSGGVFEAPIEDCDLFKELSRRLAERDGQVAGLTHAVEARDTEVAELRGEVDGLTAAIRIREDELSQQRNSLEARDCAFADMSALVSQLNGRIAERDGEIAAQVRALESRDTEIAELRSKVDGLTAAIRVREDELSQQRSALEARNHAFGDMEALVSQLNGRIGDLQRTVERLESACADRVLERDGLAHAFKAQEAEISASRAREVLLAELQGRVAALTRLAEARGVEVEAGRGREAEIAALQGRLAALTQLAEARGAEVEAGSSRQAAIADLRARLDASIQSGEAWRRDLDSERARAAFLADHCERLRFQAARLEREFEDARAEAARKATMLVERESELASLREELHMKRAELVQRAVRSTVELDYRLAEVAAAKAALAKTQHEAVEAAAASAAFERTVRALSGERDALVGQLAQRTNELSSARAESAVLTGEVLSLRYSAASSEDERDALTRRVFDLEASVGDHRKIIQQIWSSRSWRLTKGFRFIGRLLRGDWRGAVGAMQRFVGFVGSPDDSSFQPTLAGTVEQEVADAVAAPSGGELPPRRSLVAESDLVSVASDEKSAQTIRRRILLVSYYCPSRSHAGGLRILDLYALLRRKAPSIELCLYTHPRPMIDWSEDDVSAIFDRVYWSPTEELSASGLALLAGTVPQFDVVDLQFHQAALDLDGFRRIGRTILFTPMESLTRFAYLQARSAYERTRRLPLRELARGLRAVAEEVVFSFRVDKVVCVSSADAAFLRAVTLLRNVCSLETGVSEIEFRGADVGGSQRTFEAIDRTILYVAYFGSQTNVDALHWYLDQVHPRILEAVPDYRFLVVGRGDLSAFARASCSSVQLVGEVPRLAPYIEAARVGIAPALGGSGFRGKVNQYALFGVPTVVTPISAHGLAYRAGQDILVGQSAEEFAQHCINLLLDNGLNASIGANARAICAARYTWEAKWPAVAGLYGLPETCA
jgi:SAM-dependent methyltransferase/glycosyltransferase involved in cell wall biosynthesis